MKRITSDTAQSMVALWLGYLLLLIVMHMLQPDDPWTSMMARPIILVLAPLLVACIPLLAARMDSAEGDYDGDFQGTRKPSKADIARRMILVWLVSLAVFAFPLGTNTLRGILWASTFHNAEFLIVAPLLLACIPMLFPKAVFVLRATAPTNSVSRSQAWSGIVACLVGVVLAVGVLLLVNDTSLAHRGASRLWPNIAFTIALVAALMRAWYFVKLLRNPR